MSRYVDIDFILNETDEFGYENGVLYGLSGNSAPSIDIVRCEECKHNYNTVINHGKMKPRCDFTDRVLTESDFCSRGEREGE